MLFDKVIAFDHYRKTIILITNVDTSEIETNYEKAVRELDEMAELIAYGKEADIPEGKLLNDFKDEFTEEEYEALVREIQQRIHDGDIFQAVLSNGRSAALKEASSMLTGCFGQSILRPTCSTFQATT